MKAIVTVIGKDTVGIIANVCSITFSLSALRISAQRSMFLRREIRAKKL